MLLQINTKDRIKKTVKRYFNCANKKAEAKKLNLLDSLGPSNQACVGPDRPTSSSLVSLYPALGYRAIMQEMSPTAFGEEVMPSACVTDEEFRNVKNGSL